MKKIMIVGVPPGPKEMPLSVRAAVRYLELPLRDQKIAQPGENYFFAIDDILGVLQAKVRLDAWSWLQKHRNELEDPVAISKSVCAPITS